MFKINNIEYSGASVVSMTRKVVCNENSAPEMTLGGKIARSSLGGRLEYRIVIDSELMMQSEYNTLFTTLTTADEFPVVLPFGQTSITFTAYTAAISDSLTGISHDGKPVFSGLDFTLRSVNINFANF